MDIKSKKELRKLLNYERSLYISNSKRRVFNFITMENMCQNYIVLKLLRYEEYYYNLFKKNHNPISFLLFLFYRRKKNKIASKLGIYIPKNVVGRGLIIYHYGDIVINDNSIIGNNCKLHGNNCIGNDGIDLNNAPKIGNNVDIGYGAVVIGDIMIADDVIIGANAVVTKSCNKPGAVLAGVPAKEI